MSGKRQHFNVSFKFLGVLKKDALPLKLEMSEKRPHFTVSFEFLGVLKKAALPQGLK